MRRTTLIVLLVFISVSVVTCLAQNQEYVGQYDAYVGFAYLTTPNMNLAQRGFDAQFGYNWKRWLALGVDTSYFGGGSSLTVPMLNSSTVGKLAPILPHLPPGFTVWSPYHANTYTITGGPQLNYRHFKYFTLFIHPDIGAMYQNVNVHPPNPTMTVIVGSLLGPSMSTNEWVPFYGVGGGIDFNASKHVGIRVFADYVHTNLFDNLLREGQNTIRISASPTFHFGKNVPK